MLIPTMDISCLMVHAEQIKEQRHNQVGRDLKKTMSEDRNFSKEIFEVQDKPWFKKTFSNQVPPSSPRVNKSKMYSPKPQEGKRSNYYVDKPLCSKRDRKHDGKCLVGMGNFYGCGKSGHMKIYFPMMKALDRKEKYSSISMCLKFECP